MDKLKQKRLEAAGWKVGTVAEMLKLTPAQEKQLKDKIKLRKVSRDFFNLTLESNSQ